MEQTRVNNLVPLAISVSDAARLACVSRPTLYRWMNIDGFPVARIGGCVRIPTEAFKEWLENQAGVVSV